MAKLTITPIARDDLKEIGRYTQRNWGVSQRDAYLGDFGIVFERLRTGAARGRNQLEIREGILSYSFFAGIQRAMWKFCGYFTNAWISRGTFDAQSPCGGKNCR